MGKINMLIVLAIVQFSFAGISFAQDTTIIPDLTKIVSNEGWKLSNRDVSIKAENQTEFVFFNAQEGDGLAWLEGFEFNNGIIEADIKGKDLQGSSFVGIAFRGLDEQTYDAIYFRPFNFKSEDPVRKGHAVQYISQPIYTWQKLREEHPEEYENPIDPAPDPNSFFHIKIIVEKPKVSVFVNDAEKPCLVVNELSGRTDGWVGLWVGNYSEGSFANLKITRQK
ncbi:MAG TPA: hypothetical protein VLM39_03355 [Ignavibacteriaceae bacterium]|nr:hypothetical protein [Ignavibacteriaceae bacterium]